MFEALLGATRVGDARRRNSFQSRVDVNNTLAIGAGLVHENLPFLLTSLKGGGIPWFAGRYGEARNYRGISIGSGKRTIGEILGIHRWWKDTRPDFQWLVVEQGSNRQVQFLFRGGRFAGTFDSGRCGHIDFQAINPEVLLAEVRVRKKKIGEFDFGLIQHRKDDWNQLKSILIDAYCWSGLAEKREVFVVGRSSDPRQVACPGKAVSERDRTFQQIVKLAFACYRPEHLKQKTDQCFDYPLAEWTPILVFYPTEKTAREQLLAEVRLRAWLTRGGARLEDIEELRALDLETVQRFVATHEG